MSDFIPRLYAIAAIENAIMRRQPEEGDSILIEAYNSGYRAAMEQAKLELMAIKAKTDWISVENGLPQKKGNYMVTDATGHVYMAEYMPFDCYGEPTELQWWSIDYNQYVTDIIAWMPMPTAYRKGVIRNG